ncbi:MAG: hypothetical protein R3250_16280, partial [Melioribacteraceae bacterium]|nr:hypothetical protein [Melioribacteraceae bacterium]
MQINDKVKKILLVDDDIDLLEQNKTLLESKGIEVFTAESGEEGIEKFIKDINQTSRSNEQLEQQLKAYQENPMTITCLADHIGKDISEITYSWLSDSQFPLRTID